MPPVQTTDKKILAPEHAAAVAAADNVIQAYLAKMNTSSAPTTPNTQETATPVAITTSPATPMGDHPIIPPAAEKNATLTVSTALPAAPMNPQPASVTLAPNLPNYAAPTIVAPAPALTTNFTSSMARHEETSQTQQDHKDEVDTAKQEELPFEGEVAQLAATCSELEQEINNLEVDCEELAEARAPMSEIEAAQASLQTARVRLLEATEQLGVYESVRSLQSRWSQVSQDILVISKELLTDSSKGKNFSALRQQLMVLEATLDFQYKKILKIQKGESPTDLVN